MTASYWLRLLLVSFASFFLVHGAICLAVRAGQARALRFAERLRPRAAGHLLLCLRMLPPAISIAVVLGLCAPSYVRFEPNAGAERVGLLCLLAAFLGILVWVAALGGGLRGAVRSLRFTRACRRSGRVVRLAGDPSELLVVSGQGRPFLVQCGFLRPDFVISERLFAGLSIAELEAALAHERAHWLSRDNWKGLALRFMPAPLPFSGRFRAIERGWAKFTERAADDSVSAQGPGLALSLASALIRLARLRARMGEPLPVREAASSLGGRDDLSGRVHRLLALAPFPGKGNARLWMFWGAGGLLLAGYFGVLASPTLLLFVHQMVERLLH
jgi:hypothetical protein